MNVKLFNSIIPSYNAINDNNPNNYEREYNGYIFNQSTTHTCGIISILELLYLQNSINNLKDINIMNIYKYNISKGREDTIMDFISSISEYLNINIYDVCQCKTINSIKDSIIHNKGIIINMYRSSGRNYNSEYIEIYKNTKAYNHSVLSFGYTTIDNVLYLYIVNSYGKSYGNKGITLLPIYYKLVEYPYTFKSNKR